MRAFSWFLALTGLIFPVIVHGAPISITWSSPADDLSATGQQTASQQIALSADGKKATAVWTRGPGSGNQILQSASAIISGNSASWSAPTDLSMSGAGAFRPQVAVSSDGTTAIVVWEESGFIKCRLATISGNLASWGASITLSSAGTYVQVALSSDGTKATAVWRETTGTKSRSATIMGNSAVWGVTYTLSNSGESVQPPQVSLSKDGSKATAVWIGSAGGSSFIQASSATIVGDLAAWASPTSPTAPSSDPFEQVEFALSDEGGRATVVWSKMTSSVPTYVVQSVSASIVGSTASWGSVLDLSSASNTRLGAKVSLSGDGTRATAIWRAIPTGTNGIIQTSSATIQGNSASWATPISLSPAGESSNTPDVKLSSDGGRATAIWYINGAIYTPPRLEVMQASSAEIIGSVATWSPVIDVSSYPDIGNTRLSLSSDGTIAAAVWKGTYDLTSGSPKSITQSAIALIDYPSPAPQPIPTLSERAQIMMMFLMVASAGFYGWRMKQR